MANEQAVYISGYAAANQPGIYGFTFDPATGALAPTWATAGITNPSFVLAHPNGRWLYAVSETAQAADGVSGGAWALGVSQQPWRAQPINGQLSGGDLPCHLTFDPTGRWLLASNYGSGTVGVLPIQPDGSLGPLAELIRHRGSGPTPERQTGPHAHSTNFSPDGRFAIVADLGIDALMIYTFDSANGKMLPHGRTNTRPGAGPRHLAFHPNGRVAYVTNELDNTVVVYEYDAANGTLQARQTIDALPTASPGSLVAEVVVTPTGERVYVSTRGSDTITTFDAAPDGSLRGVAVQPGGGRWPRQCVLAPDGNFLLVANQYSGDVTVLPLTRDAAAVGAPVARVAVPGASCVLFAGI